MRRSYQQFCPLACALDVLGDRWTALILRDLSFGPRRFGQLEENLDGIGPNLLSQRLDRLQEAGLVERRIGDGATYATYERTPRGDATDEFLVPLSRWGLPLLADADRDRADPQMAPVAIRSMIRWEELNDDMLSARLDLDVGTYRIAVTEAGPPGRRVPFSNRISVTELQGNPPGVADVSDPPDVVMSGSIFSLLGASTADDFTFGGDDRDVQRLQRAFGFAATNR